MSDIKNITPCITDPDNIFYPGQLNVDENGDPIITPFSTQEDFIKSQKIISQKHGVTPILDLKVKYNNPNFTKSDIHPDSNINPLSGTNLTSIPDRGQLFKKLIPHIEDENFNPLLAEPEEEITYKHFLPDLNPWATVGDPRYTLGCAMQQIFQEFYPRILACQEIAEAQGAGIKEECICSEDGQQIRKASDVALYVAARTSPTSNGIKKPCFPTPEEVSTFFETKMIEARENHTAAFVRYLKICYLSNPQWRAEPVQLQNPPFFFVKLSKSLIGSQQVIDSKFFRYYYDQSDQVAELLGVELVKTDSIIATENLTNISESLGKEIPKDYYSLIKFGRRQFPVLFFEIEAAKKLGDPIPDYTTMPCPSGIY